MIVIKHSRFPRHAFFVDYPQFREFQSSIVWVNYDQRVDHDRLLGRPGDAYIEWPYPQESDRLFCILQALKAKKITMEVNK